MSAELVGRLDWDVKKDEEGHRTYNIDWLVETTHYDDGPYVVLNCPGLPAVGARWQFGNDLDPWAQCKPEWEATPVTKKEPNCLWVVGQKFSTKPNRRPSNNNPAENPLAEPPRIGGSFVKYQKEATHDRNDKALKSSTHEMFRGSVVERDYNRPTVNIEITTPTLPLGDISQMIDTVNDREMWGLQARMVKLTNATWKKLWHSSSGSEFVYFTVAYEFDIDFKKFIRKILDEGTKILIRGGDPNNPKDFAAYKDINDENTRVLLDGAGLPIADGDAPFFHEFEFYEEANLFTLGVPASLTT